MSKYTYGGKEYERVEVFNGDVIIQAFVLMSEDQLKAQDKFPFYRTYTQKNMYGYLVPPACNVGVFRKKDEHWHIFSANDLRKELKRPVFLNYNEATKRFEERFNYLGNYELGRAIKGLSIGLLCVIILYLIAHILSVNGLLGFFVLPLDSTVVSIFVMLMCLLLIPPVIPYIRSLNIGNVGIELKDLNRTKSKK